MPTDAYVLEDGERANLIFPRTQEGFRNVVRYATSAQQRHRAKGDLDAARAIRIREFDAAGNEVS